MQKKKKKKLMEALFWEIQVGRAIMPRCEVFILFLSLLFLAILDIFFHKRHSVT